MKRRDSSWDSTLRYQGFKSKQAVQRGTSSVGSRWEPLRPSRHHRWRELRAELAWGRRVMAQQNLAKMGLARGPGACRPAMPSQQAARSLQPYY